MSFFREVAESLGGQTLGSYTVINYGGKAVYIEGIKRIISVATSIIRLDCGKHRLCVNGEGLTVSELGGGCMTVTGKIFSVEEEGGNA